LTNSCFNDTINIVLNIKYMSVKAKFTVNSITRQLFGAGQGEGQIVKLSPVYGDSPENKEFYKWTPCGSVELGTINPEAGKYFELGKEYFLTFEKAQ
jgi:hypothetical protein